MRENDIDKWNDMYNHIKYAKENPKGEKKLSSNKINGWLAYQRKLYKEDKLTPYQIYKLEELGIDLVSNIKPPKFEWDEVFNYVQEYYYENGNIAIPTNYKTENGCEVGKWISIQRSAITNKKINLERINKLNNLYMIWNVKDNSYELKWLCERYSINYQLNKERMSKLPVSRLDYMINFLIDRNIPYIDENGYVSKIVFIPYIENIFDVDTEDNYSYMLVR